MDSDALLLARIQFGFTISFHIIFPAITIGLASYLAVLEGLWLRTRATVYRDLYHFWTKIFAVNFGMGVVSGLVMAYQFGTNWSFFSDFAGSITGPLLAYEVLTAFFLEAGFLGVMLFGWSRVGPGLHFFHGDGGAGHAGVGHLDPGVQQLDADAGRLRDRQRPGRAHGLAGGDLQLSFPYRLAHMGIAAFPGHGADGGRVRRLALAARRPQPGGEEDVRDGHGHAAAGCAAAGRGGRRPRTEHAQAPARQGRRHGRPLGKRAGRRRAADPVWPARHGQGGNPLRAQHPAPGQPDPHPQLGRAVPRPEVLPAADRPNVPVVFWSFRVMVGLGR